MPMIKKEIRSYFPVTHHCTFLNNAAESPMNLPFRNALDTFYNIACEAPQDKTDTRGIVRDKLSDLFGGQAEDYALITSTGVGSGMVAAGFDFQPGDNVVLPEFEHRNNLFPWLALQDKGVEVRFVAVDESGKINLSDIERLVDSKTKIVSIAAVRFNSGFRIDLKKVSDITHKFNALLFVDGIQACGVVPMNVDEMGIDVLSSAGFKWLLGIPGTGFLYVSSHARKVIKPVIPGMFAAQDSYDTLTYHSDSRKYETGSIAYSLFNAWIAGLDIVLNTGITTIYDEVLKLTDQLIKGLQDRQVTIVSSIDIRSERSAILFFTLGDEKTNVKLQKTLENKKIILCVRDGKIRISPSFYNTAKEIDYFFEILDQVLACK